MPAVYSAANEVAVARFLQGDITFLQIEDIISEVLERHSPVMSPDLETVLAVDRWARQEAAKLFR